MHTVYVRETPPSICFHYNKLGIICYPASKKDFMKGWRKAKWYYGDTIAKMKKNRYKYLLEAADCYVWFKNVYNANSTDLEINTFKDFYQIHLLHYLLVDKLIVEAGGKHDPLFGNVAGILKEVDFVWDITRKIVEYYEIDWIKFTETAVLTNA